MDTKLCTRCQVIKPLAEFYKNSRAKDGYKSECAECTKLYAKQKGYVAQRKYYQNNKDKAREADHKRRIANPEKQRTKANNRRMKVALPKEDRAIATEYRKAIKHDPCFYCGKTTEQMHDDHFFPISKGGTDHWYNLVKACPVCNVTKGAHCGTWFLLKDTKDYRIQRSLERTPIIKLPLPDTRLCKTGLHEMTPDNIWGRQCKSCHNANRRNRRHEKAASKLAQRSTKDSLT